MARSEPGVDAIAAALARIARGEIVAIKGLGGFHLACDARNAEAVARLRERKAREEKPFAVMVAGAASLARLAEVSASERAWLESCERPIVLLRKSAAADAALPGVAPGLAWLGAMLPYTPLQYLLFHEAAGRPAGTGWLRAPQELVLVMTSANPGGEPLVTANGEALSRLAGIADAFLVHDRDIVARCDDSVLRATTEGSYQFVRRARGYTPQAIRLARAGPSVVALGGWFKNTVCVTRDDEAFVSPHIGDLDNAPTCLALTETVTHLVSILEVRPAIVAHDLHPDFFSTRHAARLAAGWGVPLRAVQHHHAHIARCSPSIASRARCSASRSTASASAPTAERGAASFCAWTARAANASAGCARCVFRAAIAPRASRGGWQRRRSRSRVATTRSRSALPTSRRRRPSRRCSRAGSTRPRRAASAAGSTPQRASSASAGASRSRGRRRCCSKGSPRGTARWPRTHRSTASEPKTRSTSRRSRRGSPTSHDPAYGAALFHATVAEGLADWASATARRLGLDTVAGAGGCFLNAILARDVREGLARRGLALLEARVVPPNDGGLSLGQAWVALEGLGGN